MPSKLSERRDKKIRDVLYANWVPANVNNYDPSLGTDQSLFVPITTNWYAFNDHNPSITITNFSGSVVGGGNTGWTGLQGDGSGVNQYRFETGQITLRAENQEDYNGMDAQGILKLFADEVERIIQVNAPDPTDNELFFLSVEPFEDSPQNLDGGSVTFQMQASVGFGWLKTPP